MLDFVKDPGSATLGGSGWIEISPSYPDPGSRDWLSLAALHRLLPQVCWMSNVNDFGAKSKEGEKCNELGI